MIYGFLRCCEVFAEKRAARAASKDAGLTSPNRHKTVPEPPRAEQKQNRSLAETRLHDVAQFLAVCVSNGFWRSLFPFFSRWKNHIDSFFFHFFDTKL